MARNSITVSVNFDAEIYKIAKNYCSKRGLTFSALSKTILFDFLEKKGLIDEQSTRNKK